MVGIYKITNCNDHTHYIGKSKDIKTRIRKHKYRLTHGIHHNRYLQRVWNKYGAERAGMPLEKVKMLRKQMSIGK